MKIDCEKKWCQSTTLLPIPILWKTPILSINFKMKIRLDFFCCCFQSYWNVNTGGAAAAAVAVWCRSKIEGNVNDMQMLKLKLFSMAKCQKYGNARAPATPHIYMKYRFSVDSLHCFFCFFAFLFVLCFSSIHFIYLFIHFEKQYLLMFVCCLCTAVCLIHFIFAFLCYKGGIYKYWCCTEKVKK